MVLLNSVLLIEFLLIGWFYYKEISLNMPLAESRGLLLFIRNAKVPDSLLFVFDVIV